MAVLPGVLGCRPLRRTVQVRLEANTLRLPGGTTIFAVSLQQFMKHPDYKIVAKKVEGPNITVKLSGVSYQLWAKEKC